MKKIETKIAKNKTQTKEKSPMIITIEREAETMTISAGTGKAKVKKYFVDGEKMTRGQAEIIIRSYVQSAIETGATIEIDSRLANEFDAIAKTPYRGEFTLIHVDENGKPVKADDEKQGMFADSVDATPYHAKIIMFGDKVPMFQVICNGRELNSKRGNGHSLSQKEVDEWIIKTYQQRKQYPNLIIEVPKVVATLYLDSFACNPRFIRELNVTLTSFEEKTDEANPDDYAVTPEAMDVATNTETELANTASKAAKKNYSINPIIADDDNMKLNHVDIYTKSNKVEINGCFECKNIETAYRRLRKIMIQIDADHPELQLGGENDWLPANKITLVSTGEKYEEHFCGYNENGDMIFSASPVEALAVDINEDWFYFYGKFTIENIKEETQMTNNLPTGLIEVANGADAFALVAPYFPNGLTFKCAGKGFNHETIFSFADKNDDELWLNVCSTADDNCIDCIEVLNTHENGSKRHPLTVAIVANEKERADKLINPPIDNTDDFQSKLAELKDEYDAATLEHEKTIDAVKAAEKALQAARELEQIAAGKRIKAGNAIYHFGSAKAAKLHEKILPIEITNRPSMIITNQFNCRRNIYLETLFIAFYEYKFSIIADTDYGTCTLGEYYTPAQVERVIKMLKAAVARGDKDFISPTVEELYGTHEKKACRKVG